MYIEQFVVVFFLGYLLLELTLAESEVDWKFLVGPILLMVHIRSPWAQKAC